MTDSVTRREFVVASGAAAAGAAGNAAFAQAAARELVVHLDRLTSREVEDRMKTTDVVFVPHGPISGHGPWTTLGVHPHGAEAVAVLMARKCGGLVFPTIHTCFAGATRTYPGTVPFSYEFHATVLKTTVRSLYAQGFGRIFLICYTNPEDTAGLIAARDLFDIEGEIPVASLICTRGLQSEPVKKLISDYAGSVGEAIIDYAALRVLGHEREVVEPDLAAVGLKGGQDQNPAIREAMTILRQRGTRGFRYDSEREHSSHGTVGLKWQGRPDIELGVKILEGLADFLLPAVEALKHHRDYLRAHPAKRIGRQVPLPP
jgi:creatinine amidohydrolase/Fe(II)-dependent formamide hydrolase-like protein